MDCDILLSSYAAYQAMSVPSFLLLSWLTFNMMFFIDILTMRKSGCGGSLCDKFYIIVTLIQNRSFFVYIIVLLFTLMSADTVGKGRSGGAFARGRVRFAVDAGLFRLYMLHGILYVRP